MFEPITRKRFFEVAAEYGINDHLASDLWHVRPIDHQRDTEDEIRANLELLGKDFIERNNPKAVALYRHHYVAGKDGKCGFCSALKIAAAHNLEPNNKPAPIAFSDPRRIQ